MNIDHIRMTNNHELEQVEKYDYVVVGDSAERAREIKYLLDLLENALVPVPLDEPMEWEHYEEETLFDGAFILDDRLCCRERSMLGYVVSLSTGGSRMICDEEMVQPVRLVRVKDLEATP